MLVFYLFTAAFLFLSSFSLDNIKVIPVVYIPHRANKEVALFAHISTDTGRDLKMTMNHLVPAGVCGSSLPLIYASKVTVGDCINTITGQEKIVSVMSVQNEGIYTIITHEEYLIVNDIIVSPFGGNHMMANFFYNVHRLIYNLHPTILSSSLLHKMNEKFGFLIPLFSA